MLQAYPHLNNLATVDELPLPEYYLHILCMYNFMAIKGGIDPENPPKDDAQSDQQAPASRTVSGAQAGNILRELAKIKEGSKEKEA